MSEYLSIEVVPDEDEPLEVRNIEDYFHLWGILKLAWAELAPMYPDKIVWTTYCIYEEVDGSSPDAS